MFHRIAVSHRTAPMAVGSRVMFVAGVARAADSLALAPLAVVNMPYSLRCFCAVTLPLISMFHRIAVSHRTAPMAVGSRVMFVAGVARAADSLALAPLSSLVSSRRLGGLCALSCWCGCSSSLRLAVWVSGLVSIQFSREPTSLWAAI